MIWYVLWYDMAGIQCRYPWKTTQRYVVLWACLNMVGIPPSLAIQMGNISFFEMDLAGPSSGKISCFTALHLNILGHCRTSSQHNTTTFLLFVTVVFSMEDGDPYDRHLVVRKTFLEVVEENPSGKGLAGGKWGLKGERLQGLTGRHSDAKQNWTTKHNSWKKVSEQTYIQYIHDHS